MRLALYALLVGPVFTLVLYALSTRWFFPQLLPAEWSAAPLLRQLGSPQTREALGSSLLTAGVTTTIALLLGLPAAAPWGCGASAGGRWCCWCSFCPTWCRRWQSAWG